MNLLGLKSYNTASTLTLDKINAKLKKEAQKKNISLTIIQTHDEAKAVSYLHKKRKKYNHIIMTPGIWSINGYLIVETLTIIKTPFSIILSNEYNESIFDKIISEKNIIIDNQYIEGYLKILNSL
mgnify:CR=1 FL=1|tara:strand:+ start:256 stop:630 length:375 start_codon:yes stop_codon:yes gene_type:complete